MVRPVTHEITLIALGRDEFGVSVRDIVETSYHHAYRFTRAWLRDPEVHSIGTRRAGKGPDDGFRYHDIPRAAS